MNWDRFQTFGLSANKSFEMLCNQLFENWCKDAYKDNLLSFTVTNGSGGDGGIESYAVLKDDKIIGLQAKWFLFSINQQQMNQIYNSIKTALNNRPKIAKYIVCVPRDLSPETGRSKNCESARWEKLKTKLGIDFPSVSVELWNHSRITAELQKPCSVGIHKFWFTNSEIDSESILRSFSKAKASWLSTKYVPDLNIPGQIEHSLAHYVGDFESRYMLSKKIASIIELCKQFETDAINLESICSNAYPDFVVLLTQARNKMLNLLFEIQRIHKWLTNETTVQPVFSAEAFYISFDSIIESLKDCPVSHEYHFHMFEVIDKLKKLSYIDFPSIAAEIVANLNRQSILFLGNPGTGKTHGVSAYVENTLKQQYHIPIVIQARSIPEVFSWKDIVVNALGLADKWSEDELWQALLSAANRQRFQLDKIAKSISVLPKILIIIDGIDESSTYEKWVDRIKETKVISDKYPQIKFCFTSRPAVFSLPIIFAHVIKLNDSGETPVFKLFDGYIKAYRITVQNCRWLKFALNTPLALKLFCELHEGQSVSINSLSEVSMNRLWREKINRIQNEFINRESLSPRNQIVFKAIIALSNSFLESKRTERTELVLAIKEHCSIDDGMAGRLLDFLESYGIVGSFQKSGTGIDPDEYFYYTGIQGYFDYASAQFLINKYKHPADIDFRYCYGIDTNTLYCLAVISIQQYDYLITSNDTLDCLIDESIASELQFYALQHTDYQTALPYRGKSLDIMKAGADSVLTIVNKLVLPFSRFSGHPLGVSLFDEYLNGFNTPAHRDAIWSLPAYLKKSSGKYWFKSCEIALLSEDEEYILTADDLSDGLPVVYAWMLSNLNNTVRKKCRNALMAWAQMVPKQFFALFLHFANVNDPQIKSDLFSILMCLVYDKVDTPLLEDISRWILANVLSPSVIDQNRDISLRYYSIAIIMKAVLDGIFTVEAVRDYLPPYIATNNEIALNKDALSGTVMRGYSAIDYDLARYVLVSHFEQGFNSWKHNQLDQLVKSITTVQPDYYGISHEQFIISASYAFVLQMGWNEHEFYNTNKDKTENCIGGVDYSIRTSYTSATHGAKSEVMTICEKYVWQARNYISGFLCDRLLFGDNRIRITDYSLLDDFSIPLHEMHQIDPDSILDDRPFYVPEPLWDGTTVALDSKEAVSTKIKQAPDIDWAKWIRVDNSTSSYSIPSAKLLALKHYACFDEPYGIEINLFFNSVIIPESNVSDFIHAIQNCEFVNKVLNPTEWDGGVESRNSVSPKEVCWFSWKKHIDSSNAQGFQNLSVQSAVDRCYYYFPEYNDVFYSMPSAPLRAMLGIVDTDGYLFYDREKNIISQYCIAGEKWRTSKWYVLIDENVLMKSLHESGLTLVWITQDLRRETGKARERFGEFYVDRRQYSVVYWKDSKLVVEKLKSEFSDKL